MPRVMLQAPVPASQLHGVTHEEAIAQYENIEYIGTEFSNNDPARAAEIVTAALAANPDLNGVFATNLFSAAATAVSTRRPPPTRSTASTPSRPTR